MVRDGQSERQTETLDRGVEAEYERRLRLSSTEHSASVDRQNLHPVRGNSFCCWRVYVGRVVTGIVVTGIRGP
jgi:hypothetical protein